jgi:adenosylcobinamide kinase/adenosylcobinamide-phosphate guanylyltransferase
VLGGARSGKSLTAERLLAAEPRVTYVATAAHAPDDEEWRDRVAAHQARRPVGWTTIESAALGVDGLAELLEARRPADAPLLVDCLTLWLAHVMDVVGVWTAADDVAAKAADVELATAVDALVQAWRTTRGEVVAVSNEVGSGVVPDYPSGRRFRDELGGLNARLATASDDVLFVEAGISRSLLPQRFSPQQRFSHQPPESS